MNTTQTKPTLQETLAKEGWNWMANASSVTALQRSNLDHPSYNRLTELMMQGKQTKIVSEAYDANGKLIPNYVALYVR